MNTIILNGKEIQIQTPLTIKGLIVMSGYGDQRIAVEYNGKIIPKYKQEEVFLKNNDYLEVVTAVGGG